MKNLYGKWLWTKWWIGWSTTYPTCNFLRFQRELSFLYDYRRFLQKEFSKEPIFWKTFDLVDYYESKEETSLSAPLFKAMDKRRELMWRFLWRGERA